jgi:hypothetical protein
VKALKKKKKKKRKENPKTVRAIYKHWEIAVTILTRVINQVHTVCAFYWILLKYLFFLIVRIFRASCG